MKGGGYRLQARGTEERSEVEGLRLARGEGAAAGRRLPMRRGERREAKGIGRVVLHRRCNRSRKNSETTDRPTDERSERGARKV